ncbi:hypothetical protein [Ensifer sp.]|uniref:hypothetical protein n=1 Tax=Ensifer sp. TaxID=1872086 RepID=UPI002E15BD72|nr:hypothetical protein [Ensifer sp.]
MDEEVDHDGIDPFVETSWQWTADGEIMGSGARTQAPPTIRSAAHLFAFSPSNMRIVRLRHATATGRSDPDRERDQIQQVCAVCTLAKRRLTTAPTDIEKENFCGHRRFRTAEGSWPFFWVLAENVTGR